MTKVSIGDPVILTDASGLKKYGFYKNMEGFANQVVTVDDETYVMFHPLGFHQMYYIGVDRVAVDQEKKDAMINNEGYRDDKAGFGEG